MRSIIFQVFDNGNKNYYLMFLPPLTGGFEKIVIYKKFQVILNNMAIIEHQQINN